MIKNIILSIFIATISLGISSPLFMGRASAVEVLSPVCTNPNAAEQPSICKDNQPNPQSNPIFETLGRVINILSIVVALVATFVIIISGVKLMTSAGDPTGVATARGGIIYAVISIVITATARLMVGFLLNKL